MKHSLSYKKKSVTIINSFDYLVQYYVASQLVFVRVFLLMLLMFLISCGLGSEKSDEGNLSVAVKTSMLKPGDECANGGITVETGIDENSNGLLDEKEVDKTQVVCHGTDGNNGLTSLVMVTDEPAGVNCAIGGIKIDVGLDDNRDGELAIPQEVDNTSYVCGGTIAQPSAPQNVIAASSDAQVNISWDAVAGVTSYNIYWQTSSGVTTLDNKIANASSPYAHTSLSNDTTYCYIVTAVNSDIESNPSTEVCATPVVTAPAHRWSHLVSSSSDDYGYDIALDSSGIVYVTGQTQGNVIGGASAGGWDHFISRYNSNGDWAWTLQPGTAGLDATRGIAVDTSGNVYVTGETDHDLLANTDYGNVNAFVSQYNSDGDLMRHLILGEAGYDAGFDIAVDDSRNIYVVGETNGDFENTSGDGSIDIFVSKYNSDGNHMWTQRLASSASDTSPSIALDTAGNVYVAGRTTGGIALGIVNQGEQDIFITKYTTNGEHAWTNQPGTSGIDIPRGIALDAAGDVYITGETNYDLIGNTPLNSTQSFISKYDGENGNWHWMQMVASSGVDRGEGIALDTLGNIFLIGTTSGDLDGEENNGGADVFISKYNSTGNQQWTFLLGSPQDDFGAGDIAVDTTGNIYFTTTFADTLPGYASLGGNDAFVASYDDVAN